MTPAAHRPFRDRLRAAIDRADTWINGPDEFDAADHFLPPLTGTDDPDGVVFTATGTMIIPATKVTPNILHEPPPPPEHNCTALDICRELQAIENLRREAAHLRSFADELASR